LRISANPRSENRKPSTVLYPLLANELSRSLACGEVRGGDRLHGTAAVSAFRRGDLDLVWFGALTGVQAGLQKPGAKGDRPACIDPLVSSPCFFATRAESSPCRNQKGLTALMESASTLWLSESSTSGAPDAPVLPGSGGGEAHTSRLGCAGLQCSHTPPIALGAERRPTRSGRGERKRCGERSVPAKDRPEEVARDLAQTPWLPNYTGSPAESLDHALAGASPPGSSSTFNESQLPATPAGPDLDSSCQRFQNPASQRQYDAIEKVGVARSQRSAERLATSKPLHC